MENDQPINWNDIFNMYCKKMQERVHEIKAQKFKMPDNLSKEDTIKYMEKREEYLIQLLIGHASRWRVSYSQIV